MSSIMRQKLLYSVCLGAFIASLAISGCTSTPPVPAPAPATAAPEFHIDATIKDLMLGAIDTNADVVWLAVSFVNNDKGIVETRPKNDEEWAMVRRGALLLMETTNLLKMPGRKVAQDHEKSETPGIELEPSEMQALIEKDFGAWVTHANDLHTAVSHALAAINAKDSDKLFEIGEEIERTCENCHKTYWYPNEVIPEFKVEDLTPAPAAPAAKP
jgi:hypothetical protein